jgi:hypothetical protein
MAGKAAAIVFFVDVRKKPTPILGIDLIISSLFCSSLCEMTLVC